MTKLISRFASRGAYVFPLLVCALLVCALLSSQPAWAQSASDYGEWKTEKDADDPDRNIEVMRLKVSPKAAAFPALRHRLIPDPADRTDGNSAPFYLKAMGFVEQRNALIKLHEMYKQWRDEATKEQRGNGDYPPNNWQSMSPQSLPIDEVKEYLKLIHFQEEFLYDAARRTNYSQERAMERESNPIGYLLPEVQQMRELARQQIVRFRFAIAENRIEDAVEIVGQMLAMANHVGSDEFLVSCLVGVSVEMIAVDEGLMLSQQPDTPNLYWALAACPSPLVDMSSAVKMEREFLYRQFPFLAEVDTDVHPQGYWKHFVDQNLKQWNDFVALYNSWGNSKLPRNLDPMQLAGIIATHHDSARRFLIESGSLSAAAVEELPNTQVFFLAVVRFYDIALDEATIRFSIPYASQKQLKESPDVARWREELGTVADIAEQVLFAGEQISGAAARGQQRLALWQTVEALRMTAANEGELPKTLDELVVPAPLDPGTNRPFEYSVDGLTATITVSRNAGTRYRLIVEMQRSEQKENQ